MSRNKELISNIGLRLDGRRPNELRRIRCKLGVFSEPDGSAYLEQGLTKVLASVYGPHQVRGGRSKAKHDAAIVNCQYSMAVFSTGDRKRRPRGDRIAAEKSVDLKHALRTVIKTELYPWSQIDVYVEVLHADGGVFPACVNAATLALIDAGIPLNEYVISCSASLANNNTPIVDISDQEEMMGASLSVVALPISDAIVSMEISKTLHNDDFDKVLDKALEGCRDIKNILDEAVRNNVRHTGSSTGWILT